MYTANIFITKPRKTIHWLWGCKIKRTFKKRKKVLNPLKTKIFKSHSKKNLAKITALDSVKFVWYFYFENKMPRANPKCIVQIFLFAISTTYVIYKYLSDKICYYHNFFVFSFNVLLSWKKSCPSHNPTRNTTLSTPT